jgi:hypothetical protein
MIYLSLDYSSTYLSFDLLACMPGLFLMNKNSTTYILSFFRLLRVTRILAYLKLIFTEISDRYHSQKVVIENTYLIIRSLFILVFFAHSLICIFIAIGFLNENSSECSWLKGEYNYVTFVGDKGLKKTMEIYQLS